MLWGCQWGHPQSAKNIDHINQKHKPDHGDVLMWLMKTLLTSRCVNQRGAGQPDSGM